MSVLFITSHLRDDSREIRIVSTRMSPFGAAGLPYLCAFWCASWGRRCRWNPSGRWSRGTASPRCGTWGGGSGVSAAGTACRIPGTGNHPPESVHLHKDRHGFLQRVLRHVLDVGESINLTDGQNNKRHICDTLNLSFVKAKQLFRWILVRSRV